MRLRLLVGALFAGMAAFFVWLASDAASASGAVQVIDRAWFNESPELALTAPDTSWQATALPSSRRGVMGLAPRATWYVMRFDLTRAPEVFWAVHLPYLSGGGQVWVDGQLIGDIAASTAQVHVRWERPHLLVVPPGLLHAGSNELRVHAVSVDGATMTNFPKVHVGPLDELRPLYDRRMFWVHTVPELTIGCCLVVSVLVLLIWWRLPEEALYGWFGVATLLWGIRTLTFVMESVPQDRWPWWRLVYLASTGGFVVVMALFACRLAGLRSRWAERGLLAYWFIGPAWFLALGPANDATVNRVWTAGLIPIGIGTVVVSFMTVWRKRTLASVWLPLALAVATLSGVHDYLVVWKPDQLGRFLPAWTGERYFLLHHGANFLLVAMGALLSARFVRSVRALRELNETLESRIADREKVLGQNYTRLAELERQNAASEERKLIMREIHDGLGSRLFTSLSRVERGVYDAPQVAASLRACISEMRLALDALASDDHDLLVAFGDFMFRWQSEMQSTGVRCEWEVDVDGEGLPLAPHATLQVLRIAQEALTNVVKHARASQVDLSLRKSAGHLVLRVHDDGIGAAGPGVSTGRGIHNMRARAEQLGGQLTIEQTTQQGTQVILTLPLDLGTPG